MPEGQIAVPQQVDFRNSISEISATALFGYFDYTLVPSSADRSDLLILYGDNGSGKTTILELIFHLLSPSASKGHRGAIARVPFRSFQLVLADGTTFTASRNGDQLVGPYDLSISRTDQTIIDCHFDPESEPQFSPSGTGTEFLRALARLNLELHFLSADRRMTTDRPRYPIYRRSGPSDTRDTLARSSRRNATSNAINPASALKSAQDWIRQQVVRGTNLGAENTNSIYAEIIKRVAQTDTGTPSPDPRKIDDIKRALQILSERTEAFAIYGFTPSFAADELITAIHLAGPAKHQLVESILEPFLNSMRARLDALAKLQRITATFVNYLGSFFKNKSVSFDVAEGFTIKSSTQQPLQPSWLSSGEQQLLVLFCNTLIARETPSVFIIDEPELSLNFKWQRQLIDALLEIVSGASVQIVLATHSLEIISQHRNTVLTLRSSGEFDGEQSGAKDS
jgi:energy-coupling factor transporter ATP-binding protein EcfA2